MRSIFPKCHRYCLLDIRESALLFKYSVLLFNLDYCPIVFSNNLCEVKHFPRHKFYSRKEARVQKTFIKIFFYSRRQKSSTKFCFRREITVFSCQRAKTKMRIILQQLGSIWVRFVFTNLKTYSKIKGQHFPSLKLKKPEPFFRNFLLFKNLIYTAGCAAGAINFFCCHFIAPLNTQILDNYFRATGENICRHFLSVRF